MGNSTGAPFDAIRLNAEGTGDDARASLKVGASQPYRGNR